MDWITVGEENGRNVVRKHQDLRCREKLAGSDTRKNPEGSLTQTISHQLVSNNMNNHVTLMEMSKATVRERMR